MISSGGGSEVSPGGASEPSREWFRTWFGEEYLELYPHRDEEEAARAVKLYLRSTAREGPAARPVLDLACGAGRHLRELARGGTAPVGFDLSRTLLGEARRNSPGTPLVRGDMRYLPFRDAAFGGLTSFFTSFGYFGSRTEDRRVVREVWRVLAPGGTFMLDFFNQRRVREELVPRDERRIGGRAVVQTRRIVGDAVVKRIRIEDEAGEVREFEERVRLYTADELGSLLEDEGLRVERMYGDYDGSEFGPAAERLILVGTAA